MNFCIFFIERVFSQHHLHANSKSLIFSAIQTREGGQKVEPQPDTHHSVQLLYEGAKQTSSFAARDISKTR